MLIEEKDYKQKAMEIMVEMEKEDFGDQLFHALMLGKLERSGEVL